VATRACFASRNETANDYDHSLTSLFFTWRQQHTGITILISSSMYSRLGKKLNPTFGLYRDNTEEANDGSNESRRPNGQSTVRIDGETILRRLFPFRMNLPDKQQRNNMRGD